jgi:hypothetical protein
MRYIVELRHTDDGVAGEVTPEGTSQPQQFSGWLELLRLLEPSTASTSTPGITVLHEGERGDVRARPNRD